MGNSLKRPGDPRSPCIATLGFESWYNFSLQLVNLDGEVSDKVKISDDADCLGMVTIDGEVYVVTGTKILKILPDGKKTELAELPYLVCLSARIVAFQSQIYIIQPNGMTMLRFNPAGKTFNDNLAGCPLGLWFCCCASDSLIYAMGGKGTETSAVEYNPRTNMWNKIGPMQHGRVDASSAVMNNRVYVLCGLSNPASECYDSHSCLMIPHDPHDPDDPPSGTWCEIPSMNVQGRLQCALIIDNRLYAINDDSIQVYNDRGWKRVTQWKGRRFHYCCVWPYDTEIDQVPTM